MNVVLILVVGLLSVVDGTILFAGCGTITITYSFPSGIQGREHPHPDETYNGTSRTISF